MSVDGDLPPEFVRLMEQARRNEYSGPKKHHLVPSSYLRRWEVAGKLRVTDVEAKRSHTTAAAKAARETDFYRLEADGLDPELVPPLLFETLLSQVEGWGKRIIDELVSDTPTLTIEQRAVAVRS